MGARAEAAAAWNAVVGEWEEVDRLMRLRTRRARTLDVYLRVLQRGQSSAVEMRTSVLPMLEYDDAHARREAKREGEWRVAEFRRRVRGLRGVIERERPCVREVRNQVMEHGSLRITEDGRRG